MSKSLSHLYKVLCVWLCCFSAEHWLSLLPLFITFTILLLLFRKTLLQSEDEENRNRDYFTALCYPVALCDQTVFGELNKCIDMFQLL